MSYDVWIMIDSGRGLVPLMGVGSMTSNVACMWNRAMPARESMPGRYWGDGEPQPGQAGLAGLSGMRASDAVAVLEEGIRYMRDHADELRAMEPANGWGRYQDAMLLLERLRQACELHPAGVVGVSS